MLEDNFDSITNHLNSSPRFLDCLMLDLTVTDLMPIAHMDKIWVEIAKKLRCGRPEGGGVVSDFGHPRTRGGGGGGSKNGKFLRTSFMDGPLLISV